MRVILWLFFFLIIYPSFSQKVTLSHRRDREFSGFYDNDIFFITDQYYTSGIQLSYGRITKQGSLLEKVFNKNKQDASKLISRYTYGHKIFTPLKIRERLVELRDRPYAGWHYGGFEITKVKHQQFSYLIALTAGVVGEKSGIGNFQKWYHANTGITAPIGWEYQIENEFIVEFAYSLFHRAELAKRIDIVNKPTIAFGNLRPSIGHELRARIGKKNGLDDSSINNTRLSERIPTIGDYDPKQEEAYFFIGLRGEYIFHNTLIEGSLFKNESPHTEEAEPFVISQIFGGVYSTYYASFTLTIERLSDEVVNGDSHRFVRFALSFRF